MTDLTALLDLLDTVTRPRLLISAARLGAAQYRRDIHLPRHLGTDLLPDHAVALEALIEIEAELDEERRARRTGYAVARHVDVMIALMGEARLLRAEMGPEAERAHPMARPVRAPAPAGLSGPMAPPVAAPRADAQEPPRARVANAQEKASGIEAFFSAT